MELALFQQFCGISSNVTQAGHVISFYNDIVGRYTPIIITLAQLLGTFVSIKLLKAFELKHLTLFGGLILTICNAALGVLFYEFYSNAWRYSMQLSLTVLIAYMFTFGLTLGSTVWPYISLLLPQNLIKVATFLNWVSAGICIALFEMITGYLHSPYPVYFFYSGITLVASCLNSYLMEPMRGR